MSQLFDKALKSVTPDVKQFVDNSMNIVDRIHVILKLKGITQRQLAEMLGKKESEISKWLGGTHNFTLRSISKIETVLGQKIITTPKLTSGSQSKSNTAGRHSTHQRRKKDHRVKPN